jgi:hypothetical protein
MQRNWDAAIRALVLVKIGQELGCEGRIAHVIHDVLELAITLPTLFL